MANRPLLDRAQLARIAQNVPETIRGLERLLGNVAGMPSTIEEANALAGSALVAAQSAMAAYALLAEALAKLEGIPAPGQPLEQDDATPRAHLGTISSQNADQVEVTGGAIDGTAIGQAKEAAGKFTTLAATSYVGLSPADENVEIKPTGTGSVTIAPAQAGALDNVVIGATTPRDGHFLSLFIAYGFACNGAAPQGPHALGPAAVDAASAQALVNNIRTALIANGIGA